MGICMKQNTVCFPIKRLQFEKVYIGQFFSESNESLFQKYCHNTRFIIVLGFAFQISHVFVKTNDFITY